MSAGGLQTVLLTIRSSHDPGELSFANWGKLRVVNEVERLLTGVGEGIFAGTLDVAVGVEPAEGVWQASTATGVVGVTIGGRAVTVTAAGGDAATADALAAAINADSVASTYVKAVSRVASGQFNIAGGSGVLTASFVVPGALANGSQPVTYSVSVTWATSDAATATALAAAINSATGVPVIAVVTGASSVAVYYQEATLADIAAGYPTGAANTNGNSIGLLASGTGITSNSQAFLTNGGVNGNVMVRALSPGTAGNGITLATAGAGTGQSVATGANLVGGIGVPGNNTFVT